jgi:hemoglobin-like flavoprotein
MGCCQANRFTEVIPTGTNQVHKKTLKVEDDGEIHMSLSKAEIALIRATWNLIKEDGMQTIGEELFIRFFAAAPETFQMFSDFTEDPEWKNSRAFKGHCKIVMNMIRGCVQSLEKEEGLGATLDYIGLKHHGFGITQQQFDIC